MITKYSSLKKAFLPKFMYHHTSPENAEKILKEGLKVGSPWEKTQGAKQDILNIYGESPVFLALNPNKFKEEGDVTLKVDVSDLPLIADIPSIADKGAYYSEEGLYFEEDTTPFELMDYIEDEEGMFYYADLLKPSREITRKMIEFTQTAACPVDIPPNRIQILK